MGLINRLHTFIAFTTAEAAKINQEFNQILGLINGGLENINVKVNAGIRQDEGKLVLDYTAIRAALGNDPNTLNGAVLIDGTVTINKLEYVENDLVPLGFYNNTTPAAIPVTVPANTFLHFMQVFFTATVECSGDQDRTNPRKIRLTADTNVLSSAFLGEMQANVSESGDSFTTRLQISGWCYIRMDASSNNYTSGPPTLVKSASHVFDIVEANGYTLLAKQIHFLGR